LISPSPNYLLAALVDPYQNVMSSDVVPPITPATTTYPTPAAVAVTSPTAPVTGQLGQTSFPIMVMVSGGAPGQAGWQVQLLRATGTNPYQKDPTYPPLVSQPVTLTGGSFPMTLNAPMISPTAYLMAALVDPYHNVVSSDVVPPITMQMQVPAPTITKPAGKLVETPRDGIWILGTSQPNSIVNLYRSQNGQRLSGEQPIGTFALTGGSTTFRIFVPVRRNMLNEFVAVTTLLAGGESKETVVPPIRHTHLIRRKRGSEYAEEGAGEGAGEEYDEHEPSDVSEAEYATDEESGSAPAAAAPARRQGKKKTTGRKG